MGRRRLRFKFTNVISRVFLLRAHRVKPVAPSSVVAPAASKKSSSSFTSDSNREEEPEEERSLIAPAPAAPAPAKAKKKNRKPVFGYSCCSREEAIVRENCQYKRVKGLSKKPVGAASSRAAPMVVASRQEEEMWEREGLWSVIAAVDSGKVVKKKVVLKKRKKSQSSPRLLRAPANSEISAMEEQVLIVGQAARVTSDPSSSERERKGSSTHTFRLSTSSGDASLGPEALAWDKEHSLFASDDSSAPGSSKLVHRATTLEDEQRHEAIEEVGLKNHAGQTPRPKKSSSSSSASTSGSSGGGRRGHHHRHHLHHHHNSSFHLSRNHASGNKMTGALSEFDELGLLLSSSSKMPPPPPPRCDGKRISSASSLESSAKFWEDGREVASKVLPEFPRHKVGASAPALDDHARTKKKKKPKDLVRGKVRESVPVMLVSSNPYEDFRQSMVQMIFEKRLNKAADLEELLECYLYLNPPGFHEVIVQVFTDLWLQALSTENQQQQNI